MNFSTINVDTIINVLSLLVTVFVAVLTWQQCHIKEQKKDSGDDPSGKDRDDCIESKNITNIWLFNTFKNHKSE